MKNTIENALIRNNKFATERITADQIGVDAFDIWTNLCKALYQSAYRRAESVENASLVTENDETVKLATEDCYKSVKALLDFIGQVNGHALLVNSEIVECATTYSVRRGNKDSATLQLINSRLANRKRELAKAEAVDGINPEYINQLRSEIVTLTENRTVELAKANARIKQVTRTAYNSFRLDIEHALARAISGQLAKSWEELEAEVEARREARKKAAKARKNAKK